jgi:uncharacterized membrane protein YkvA (DUF1232 family)
MLSRVGRLGSMVRWLPTLGRLALRLFRDERVPRKHRAVLAASVGYAVLPIDLSPDFIPAIGKIDDLIVLAAGLGWIMKFTPDEVIDDHLQQMGITRRDLEDALTDIATSLVR